MTGRPPRPALDDAAIARRNALVVSHQHLVQKIAKRIWHRIPRRVRLEELVSEGNWGLLGAAQTFDPGHGVLFSTYAAPRVRGEILDHLRRVDHLGRRTRHKAKLWIGITQAIRSRLGREPTDAEVGDCLGVTLEQLDEWRRAASRGFTAESLSMMGAGTREENPQYELTDHSAIDPLAAAQTSEVNAVVARLPERDRRIVHQYYYEGLTQREIGLMLGVNESRISQLLLRSIKALRKAMQDRPRKGVVK